MIVFSQFTASYEDVPVSMATRVRIKGSSAESGRTQEPTPERFRSRSHRRDRIHRHLSHFMLRPAEGIRAYLDDDSGGLVAHHHGPVQQEVAAAAVLPVVHVRAADAHAVHVQQHLCNRVNAPLGVSPRGRVRALNASVLTVVRYFRHRRLRLRNMNAINAAREVCAGEANVARDFFMK
ncbi:hypothetical protein EVAR_86337_1 [Eumeta japonica]|uniref:Uncharacterized protein n=1 Tax=Eumeta variegata TaxID=151549 RepID=A0A4C1X7F6_EUMVA|nr:hypothetical protein EVAR_86337_1 [Eumeta japonica]